MASSPEEFENGLQTRQTSGEASPAVWRASGDRPPVSVAGEIERLRKENEDLKEKLRELEPSVPVTPPSSQDPEQLSIPSSDFQIENSKPAITNHSSIQEKIALFRSLFRGREDVYTER